MATQSEIMLNALNEWRASGRPGSEKLAPGNEKFTTLVNKSTKKNKKTQISPQEKAIQDLIKNTANKYNKLVEKATSQTYIEQNKTANAGLDKSRKEQAKYQEALNKDVAAAKEKGVPLDVQQAIGSAIKEGKPAPAYFSRITRPDTTQNVQEQAVQSALSPSQKLAATLKKETDKVEAVKQATKKDGGGFDWTSPGDWVDAASNVTQPAWGVATDVAGRGIDVISRPDYVAMESLRTLADPDSSMSDVFENAKNALQGKKKTSFLDVIREVNAEPNPQTGEKVLPDYGIMGAALGFGGDVLLSPTTYLSASAVAKGAKGILAGKPARAAIDLEAQAAKAGLKSASISTASKKAVSRASRLATESKRNYIQAGGVIGKQSDENLKFFDDIMKSNGGDLAGAQTALQHKVLSDIGVEKQLADTERLMRENTRVPQFNFMGKPVGKGAIAKIDTAARAVGRGARHLPGAKQVERAEAQVADSVNRMFKTSYYFPGKTHELNKLAQERGIIAHRGFVKDVRDKFQGVTKAERIRIADAIEHGHDMTGAISKGGKDLGDLTDWVKAQRDMMFNEDMNLLGKYVPADHSDNFMFHFYRSGRPFVTPEKIEAWKKARKAALRANDTDAIARNSLAEAEKAGLKPLRKADDILIAHYGDHTRRLVRDDFMRKVVENYGMVTDNHMAAHSLGLVPYSTKSLRTRPIPGMRVKKGFNLYLTPESKKVLQDTQQIFRTSDDSVRGVFRSYDHAMQYWKAANTVVNPAHHVRNSISDFFMNYMDGVVNPHRYKQSLDLLDGAKRGSLRFKVGGRTLTGDEMWHLYQRSGTAQGFIASELRDSAMRHARGVYNFAEHREEWTRLAHFLDTVIKDGAKVSPNNQAGLWKVVRDAGRRVNKWNIDYSDLTHFERNVMKRAVPFYTFYRKALPLMLESLATKPGRLLTVPRGTRAIENLAGIDPEDRTTPIPQWLEQLGYARLTGSTEPITWSPGIPTQLPGDFFGGGISDTLRKGLSMTNPISRAIIEKATGRSLTTGGPASGDVGQFTNTALQGTLEAALKGKEAGNFWRRFNKLSGLGIYQVTDSMQASELRRQEQPIKAQIADLNQKLGAYSVRKIKGGYRLYDDEQKRKVKDFSDEASAYLFGIQLSQTQKRGT